MLSRLYFLTALSSVIILVIHWYADTHALYFEYKWLDIPMHLFGGFIVALLGICLYRLYPKRIDEVLLWVLVLLFVLTIGSFWEIFELSMSVLYHVQTMDLTNIYDTTADLINDTLGGLAALLLARAKNWYEQ